MAINYGSNDVTSFGRILGADGQPRNRTLYFTNTLDNSWDSAANWYLDEDLTTSASVPNSQDDVILLGPLNSSSSDITVRSITVKGSGNIDLNSGTGIVINSNLFFYDTTSFRTTNSSTINGDVEFYDDSYLYSGGAISSVIINGNVKFKNNSYIDSAASTVYLGNSLEFFDSSYIESGVTIYCKTTSVNAPCSISGTIFHGDVNINSKSLTNVNGLTIYDGNLTLYNGNTLSGNGPNNNLISNGKLIFKDGSYMSNDTYVGFEKISELVLDNYLNTSVCQNCTIYHDPYDSDNITTISVNAGIPTYGWMFGSTNPAAKNDIRCTELIFNNTSFINGYNNYSIEDRLIFNDESYMYFFDDSYAYYFSEVIFNDLAYCVDNPSLCFLVIFNNRSYNNATISIGNGYGARVAIFNDESINSGTISHDAIFNGKCVNNGTVDAIGIFNDLSVNTTGSNVNIAYYYSPIADDGGSTTTLAFDVTAL